MTPSRPRTLRAAATLLACAALAAGTVACGGDDETPTAGGAESAAPPAATTAPATPATPAPPAETTEPGTGGPVELAGGTTRLRLDPAVASALRAAGVEVAPVGGARRAAGTIELPVTGGAIERQTNEGEVRHAGGLELRAAGQALRLEDFVVDPAADVLTAEVAGRRVPLFSLDAPLPVVTEDEVRLGDVVARISPAAAPRLDEQLGGLGVLREGLRFGELEIRAQQAG